MGRTDIQVIWFSTTSKSNSIIPSDGEVDPKRSTNIYSAMSSDGNVGFEID